MSVAVEPFALDLPADSSAPRLARSAVSGLFGEHPRHDDLLLCVSEVVTNAVLHARSRSTLRVQVDGEIVRVEVHDDDPTLPVRRDHDLHAPTGRGLRLLDELTTAWGAEAHGHGKVVWFELDVGGGRR
jgi:anti-sigma regulatory factor (Ser/Thr protein kinase)